MAVNLYDHQKKAVERLRSGSVLCGGVGTGKSLTALSFYFSKICGGTIAGYRGRWVEPDSYIPLYIITTARKRDTMEWEAELTHFPIPAESVVVDSWNNIGKYEDVEDAFFIFDEQRLVGYGAWSRSFLKIAKRNRWILLSATPGDQWLDYCVIFVANGFYKNKTDFVRQHVIYKRFVKFPQIDRYVGTKKLERLRDEIVIKMDFEKKATQHHNWILVGYEDELYSWIRKNRWNIYENRPIRNVSEYTAIVRKVVNSDARRLEALWHIFEKRSKIVLFYNFDYELDMIKKFLDEKEIVYSEWNGHKHEAIPDGAAWVYLVQYTAGSEGWNCITTDTIVFYSQSYSYKASVQAAGRIDRMNTPFSDLYYYHIFSDSPIDTQIRKCLKNKKNFNASILSDEFDLA